MPTSTNDRGEALILSIQVFLHAYNSFSLCCISVSRRLESPKLFYRHRQVV